VNRLPVGWHWAGELTHHQAVGDWRARGHQLHEEGRARARALVVQAAGPGRVHLPGAPPLSPSQITQSMPDRSGSIASSNGSHERRRVLAGIARGIVSFSLRSAVRRDLASLGRSPCASSGCRVPPPVGKTARTHSGMRKTDNVRSMPGGRRRLVGVPHCPGLPQRQRRRWKGYDRIGALGDPIRNGRRHSGQRRSGHPSHDNIAAAAKLRGQGRGSPTQQAHAVTELLRSHGRADARVRQASRVRNGQHWLARSGSTARLQSSALSLPS